VFSTTGRAGVWHLHQALMESLQQLGYAEGKNIFFEHRFAEGKMDQLPAIASELVSLGPDLVVVGPNTTVRAVMQASSTVPIVMTYSAEPVASGLIASLARPGGNITGLSVQSPELAGKRLELLREVVQGLRRLAILVNVDYSGAVLDMREAQAAARTLGLDVATFEVRRADDIASAFGALKGADALYVCADPLLNTNRIRIITLANIARLPTMHAQREAVEAGGLMSYGPDTRDLFRRTAELVDKILRGAKPADLPVEQPTKFDFIINLTTAKALGLEVPPTLLARADEVIE
jgi:putative ABC transport system substrate-binding protein